MQGFGDVSIASLHGSQMLDVLRSVHVTELSWKVLQEVCLGNVWAVRSRMKASVQGVNESLQLELSHKEKEDHLVLISTASLAMLQVSVRTL